MPCNFLENCQGGCAEVSTVFINPDIYILHEIFFEKKSIFTFASFNIYCDVYIKYQGNYL